MLVAFDFDGALAENDMTVALAAEAGVEDEVAAIADRAATGDVDHAEGIRERVALFEGLSADRVDSAFDRVKLRSGAADLLADLREAGHRVAVVSEGFERGVDHVFANRRPRVDADDVVANRLVFDDHDALIGDVEGPLLDGSPADALDSIATAAGVPMTETLAVGGRAYSLPMLQAADDAVGFHPDAVVEDYVDYVRRDVGQLRLHFEDHGLL
ncbi:MAG: HAD-IB family phosphatase [Halobacteriaceae archaeon]